jgi:predicted PurR-regulated permease PerM
VRFSSGWICKEACPAILASPATEAKTCSMGVVGLYLCLFRRRCNPISSRLDQRQTRSLRTRLQPEARRDSEQYFNARRIRFEQPNECRRAGGLLFAFFFCKGWVLSALPALSTSEGTMFGRNDITRNRAGVVFLLGLTVLALYLCYLLIAPFLKPILFAFIFAIVFYPVHAKIRHWVRNRNAGAALSATAVILVVGVLSFLIGRALVSGLHDIYDSLSGSGESRERLTVFIIQLFDRAISWASHYVPISVPNLQSALLGQVEKAVASVLGATAGFVGSLSAFGLNTFIAIFAMFFLLRDGKAMSRRVAVILPLRLGQARRLFSLVRETLHAIVYGTLAMAALQGTLMGLAFWFLGLASPAVWGLLATGLAVLPIVGTTCVWLPAAGMLLVSGHWVKGLVLIVWGVAVVHSVDNILRPYLIGGRVKLSTLYVFFAVVGGLKAFGALGLFLGPLILSLTAALFTFLREEKRAGTWSLDLSRRDHEALEPITLTRPSK